MTSSTILSVKLSNAIRPTLIFRSQMILALAFWSKFYDSANIFNSPWYVLHHELLTAQRSRSSREDGDHGLKQKHRLLNRAKFYWFNVECILQNHCFSSVKSFVFFVSRNSSTGVFCSCLIFLKKSAYQIDPAIMEKIHM